jgi:uncharacterized protein (TIGR02145 family)
MTVTVSPKIEGGDFTDSRDNHQYKWVKIGDQTWLAENLVYDNGCSKKNWVNRQDLGWCGYYENNKEKYFSRGLLYQWSAAMNGSSQAGAQGVCPSGWHVPSDEDFNKLELFLGADQSEINISGWIESGKVGQKLKAFSWGGTDEYGFSAIPAGFRYSDGSYNFASAGEFTNFWSSNLVADDNPNVGEKIGQDSWYRTLGDGDGIYRFFSSYSSAASVRCLKN